MTQRTVDEHVITDRERTARAFFPNGYRGALQSLCQRTALSGVVQTLKQVAQAGIALTRLGKTRLQLVPVPVQKNRRVPAKTTRLA
jgi:hypothetical protein